MGNEYNGNFEEYEKRGISIFIVLLIVTVVFLAVVSVLMAVKVRKLESEMIYLVDKQQELSDVVNEMAEAVDSLNKSAIPTATATNEPTPAPETNKSTPVPEPNGPVPVSRN